jgi:DNA repair protein REV1
MRNTSAVQPLSCDEAYLDVTGLGDPEEIAARVRSQIKAATGCPASVGIGPNPLVARLVRVDVLALTHFPCVYL